MSAEIRDGRLRLVREPGLRHNVVDLLARVEWGTSGPRYRLLDPAAELATVSSDSHVWSAYVGRDHVGTYVLSPRTWRWGRRTLHGYYRGLLAVDPERKRAGYGRFLVEAIRDRYLHGEAAADFLYGFIEEDNEASLQLSEAAGYRSAGQFQAYVFSRSGRLEPQPDVCDHAPDVLARAAELERSPLVRPEIEAGLRERPHRWLERGGAPSAMVAIKRKRWRFTHLPGFAGWMAKTVGPHLPVVRRLFRPNDFRFVMFGHTIESDDGAEDFERLLAHVLAEAGCRVALTFEDPRCPRVDRWTQRGAFGVLQRLGFGSKLHFMVGLRSEIDGLWAELERGPLPLSVRDDA